jgi:hypothetical protein
MISSEGIYCVEQYLNYHFLKAVVFMQKKDWNRFNIEIPGEILSNSTHEIR